MSHVATGHCTSRDVRSVPALPFAECYRCTRCPRDTGSAIVPDRVIEHGQVTLFESDPVEFPAAISNGNGQITNRCSGCHADFWYVHSGAAATLRSAGLGALDGTGRIPTDMQVCAPAKPPRMTLPDQLSVYPEFYHRHAALAASRG